MIKMCYHEIKEEDDGNFDVYMEHMYMCLANFMALGDIALYYAMLFEVHKNMGDFALNSNEYTADYAFESINFKNPDEKPTPDLYLGNS